MPGGVALGAGIGATSYEEPKPTPGEWNLHFWSREANAAVGSVIGGLAGLAIGGILGSGAGQDQVYHFTEKTHAQKLTIIRNLISKMKN